VVRPGRPVHIIQICSTGIPFPPSFLLYLFISIIWTSLHPFGDSLGELTTSEPLCHTCPPLPAPAFLLNAHDTDAALTLYLAAFSMLGRPFPHEESSRIHRRYDGSDIVGANPGNRELRPALRMHSSGTTPFPPLHAHLANSPDVTVLAEQRAVEHPPVRHSSFAFKT
jgi:hypothetical protein